MITGPYEPAFSNPTAWNIRAYTEMLNAIQELTNRAFTSEWTHTVGNKTEIYLRHDVDFSLECAVEMAAAEQSTGVLATYFVEVECPFYNLLSATATRQVRRIAAMGHPVGLHLVLPSPGDGAAGEALESQLGALKSVLGDAVTSVVSLHQPMRHDEVARRLRVSTTYDPVFFDEATYLSDSAGQWGGSADRWLARIANHERPAQLLIHPLWWTQPGETPREKLQGLINLIGTAAELELTHFRAWNERGQA